jgi:hypothetical protein
MQRLRSLKSLTSLQALAERTSCEKDFSAFLLILAKRLIWYGGWVFGLKY